MIEIDVDKLRVIASDLANALEEKTRENVALWEDNARLRREIGELEAEVLDLRACAPYMAGGGR